MKYLRDLPKAKKPDKQQLEEVAKVFGLDHNCYAHQRMITLKNKTKKRRLFYCGKCLDVNAIDVVAE